MMNKHVIFKQCAFLEKNINSEILCLCDTFQYKFRYNAVVLQEILFRDKFIYFICDAVIIIS